jgi:hypothetical protein
MIPYRRTRRDKTKKGYSNTLARNLAHRYAETLAPRSQRVSGSNAQRIALESWQDCALVGLGVVDLPFYLSIKSPGLSYSLLDMGRGSRDEEKLSQTRIAPIQSCIRYS